MKIKSIIYDCNTFKSLCESILVTYEHVLCEKKDRYQVWSKQKKMRSLGKHFKDQNNTEEGLLSLLNKIYPELFRDSMQVSYLLYHCHYKILCQCKENAAEKNNSNTLFLDQLSM